MRTPAARPLIALLLLAVSLTLGGCGDDTSSDPNALPDKLTVSDAWVRATTGTQDPSMTAAFMVIGNGTDEDVRLTSASSPVSDMVQIHEMTRDADGGMVMQEAPDGVTVRAGKEQMLAPGGFHVMLMNLTDELAPGDEVDLTLEFSNGSKVDVTAPVKEYTEEENHYHSTSPSPSDSMSPSMSSS